jgi:hypothetical protein
MTRPIAKQTFLDAIVCATRGWFTHRAAREEVGHGLAWKFWYGQEVERRVSAWLGEGIELQRTPIEDAAGRAKESLALTDSAWRFQATFLVDGLVARADAVRRTASGFELVEIKSAKSPEPDEKVKREHLDDVAFTAMVATRAGLSLSAIRLATLNRDYTLGSATEQFVLVDVTDAARARAQEFDALVPGLVAAVNGDEKPTPALILDCRSCEYFDSQCIGVGLDEPLFIIPRLSAKKLEALRPYERVSNVPEHADLTPNQRRVVTAFRAGEPLVDADAMSKLDQVVWPAYYLDFETVMPPLPWFPGTGPYASVPSQYSLHVRADDRATPVHSEYLADHASDWRREITERMLDALGARGSVIVYSSYERQQLNGLSELFPDLAGDLHAVMARLFDLETVVKEGYVHPGFRGRTSIKKVLPVMAPELSYDAKVVNNGDDALGLFSLMRVGRIPVEEIPGHRAALLEYCKLDTLAMVRVHEELLKVRHRRG